MFGKLFLGETKKLIKPKGLIAIAIIFVIFFIIYAVFYHIDFDKTIQDLEDVLGNLDEVPDSILSDEDKAEILGYINVDFVKMANPDNIDDIIAEFTEERDEYAVLNKTKGSKGAYGSIIYYYDSVLSLLNYMKANNVYGDIDVEGYTVSILKAQTAENFTMDYFSFVTTVLAIYGIVLAAGLFADEYSKGTIKLVMLRPVGRNTLTSAKLLALFAHIAGILGVSTLIAYIYGAIAFDVTAMTKCYVVFNSKSVFVSTDGAMTLCKMFFGFVGLLSIISLSYALGTVTRKKTLAIILTILVDLGIVSTVFSMFRGERFLYSTNLNLSVYFGLGRSVMSGGNFFIALPIYLVYTAVIFFALYFTVKKRDVI